MYTNKSSVYTFLTFSAVVGPPALSPRVRSSELDLCTVGFTDRFVGFTTLLQFGTSNGGMGNCRCVAGQVQTCNCLATFVSKDIIGQRVRHTRCEGGGEQPQCVRARTAPYGARTDACNGEHRSRYSTHTRDTRLRPVQVLQAVELPTSGPPELPTRAPRRHRWLIPTWSAFMER